MLNVDFGLQDTFCDAHDIESAWNGTEVPADVLRFFGALFNFRIQISITLVVILVASMTQCQSYFKINQHILHVNQMYQKVV